MDALSLSTVQKQCICAIRVSARVKQAQTGLQTHSQGRDPNDTKCRPSLPPFHQTTLARLDKQCRPLPRPDARSSSPNLHRAGRARQRNPGRTRKGNHLINRPIPLFIHLISLLFQDHGGIISGGYSSVPYILGNLCLSFASSSPDSLGSQSTQLRNQDRASISNT
jgi:hypothetical protein